jgi:broad-specificity NMP kinase
MLAIEQARQEGRKLICFVTGVPGSGKTLAGLNIIHNRDLHEGSLGVFLSGNGPLVKVLSEALARDHSERTGQSIAESRRRVSTFIQNVHRFIDAHFTSSIPPPDRVVVFDEAQRAWNREQSQRKFKRDRSEPEIMLDIMDRHEGWAVIVALVGGGQEINTGEAGLGEWGRALADRFQHWTVLVSPHAVKGAPGDHSDVLFDTHSRMRGRRAPSRGLPSVLQGSGSVGIRCTFAVAAGWERPICSGILPGLSDRDDPGLAEGTGMAKAPPARHSENRLDCD